MTNVYRAEYHPNMPEDANIKNVVIYFKADTNEEARESAIDFNEVLNRITEMQLTRLA